ncbi:MAG: hypothetical protein RBS49_09500, partial [Sphaerochaeta sp.]|nr:hypothetical protein [Sphaerochaeta sp.]
SENALKNAISRTIDMTKRLGLSKDQMEEVIRRTADLSAGKTDLEGGIERVTAALRGEAESAEYLGLTLNEDYVKGWYAANAAHERAWKDLTDLEKAQVRYQVFLEQSAEMEGRAAESATTFGGALELLKATIEDTVSNNQDLAESLTEVAQFIRDNADSIGELASDLIELTTGVIRFALEWKEVIAALGVGYAAFKTTTTLVRGLTAATIALEGTSLAGWFTSLAAAARTATVAGAALTSWMGLGLVLAAGWSVIKIMDVVSALMELKHWSEVARQAEEDRASIEERANEKARELGERLGMNIKSLDDFNRLVKDGTLVWNDQAQQWEEATRAMEQQARAVEVSEEEFEKLQETLKTVGDGYGKLIASASKYFDFAAEKAKALAGDERSAADAALEIYREKKDFAIQMAQEAADEQYRIMTQAGLNDQQWAAAQKLVHEDLKATKIRILEEWEGKVQSALMQALGEEKKYAAEVKRLQEELRQAHMSTEEKIMELRRRTMSAEDAWIDKQRQAYDTLRQAQEAVASAKSPEQLERAAELAKKAQDQFAGLAGEVKEGDQVIKSEAETVQAAIEGVQSAGQLIDQAIQKQIDLTETFQDEAASRAQSFEEQLQGIKSEMDAVNSTQMNPKAVFQVDSSAVDAKIAQLNGMVTHSTHIIHVQEVQERHSGGWAGAVGELHGGGIAAYASKAIQSALKPGEVLAKLLKDEFVFSPKATRAWGPWLDAMNSLRITPVDLFGGLNLPQLPSYHDGGPVGAAFGSPSETMTLRLEAGGAQAPLQVVGAPRTTKAMLQEIEKELIKMRLTRGR